MRNLLIIGIGIAVLAGAYVATASMVGQSTQKRVGEHAAGMKTDGLPIRITDYTRGMLTSEATVVFDPAVLFDFFADAESSPSESAMRIPVTIRHGPILFSEGVLFGLGAVSGETALPLFDENDEIQPTELPVQLYAAITSERVQAGMTSQKVSLVFAEESGEGAIYPFDMRLDMAASGESGRYDLRWNGVAMTQASETMEIGPVRYNGDFEEILEEVYVGEGRLSLDRFLFQDRADAKSGRLRLEALSVDTRTVRQDDRDFMESLTDIEVADIDISGKTFSIEDGRFAMDMAVRNMYAPAISTFQQSLRKDRLAEANSKEVIGLVEKAWRDLAKALFKQGLEIGYDGLVFEVPQGRLEGHMRVAARTDERYSVDEPETLVTGLEGMGEMRADSDFVEWVIETHVRSLLANRPGQGEPAPERIAEMRDAQIDQFLETGLVARKDDAFVSPIRLKEGVIRINDRPVVDLDRLVKARFGGSENGLQAR